MLSKFRLEHATQTKKIRSSVLDKSILTTSLISIILITLMGCQSTIGQTETASSTASLSTASNINDYSQSTVNLQNADKKLYTNDTSRTSIKQALIREHLRHEYILDNGLKIIIKEDHRAPVVMTQVWYHVGSTDEPDGLGGISHLLEHMMFKGTDKVSGMDFDRLIAKFGGDQNAFTSHDYTGYYEMLPANRLSLALELEADRMMNLKFDSADFIREFAQEREVVIEERRQRTDDSPVARSFETFRMMALPDSPKGQSVIGPIKDIKNIDIKDLKDWYDTWYTPNNATLVIVGDVNPDEAMAQIKHYFADLPEREVPTRPSVSQEGFGGFKQKILYETVNVPTLLMAFNVPTLPSIMHANSLKANHSEQEVYDLLALQFILDGGYAARFESRLVRQKKLLASIVSYYDPYERGDGLFLIQATPSNGVSLQEAQDAILQEINNLKHESISKDEIERAHGNLVKGFIFSQDSMSGQAYMIGSMQSRGLDDRLIEQLPQRMIDSNQERIKSIANKYFVEDNLTVLHVEPY